MLLIKEVNKRSIEPISRNKELKYVSKKPCSHKTTSNIDMTFHSGRRISLPKELIIPSQPAIKNKPRIQVKTHKMKLNRHSTNRWPCNNKLMRHKQIFLLMMCKSRLKGTNDKHIKNSQSQHCCYCNAKARFP